MRMLGACIDLQLRELCTAELVARQQITKLKIYAGPEHPHEAQNPKPLEPNK